MANSPAKATNQRESGTYSDLKKSRYVLTRNKAEVVAMLAGGEAHAEVARLYGCSQPAVTQFADSHREAIEAIAAEIERQVQDYWIGQKVNRIADAQADYDRIGAVIEARAQDTRYDEPGYETGLMTHRLKQVGTGKSAVVVDEFEVDTSLIAERRTLRRSVAEELADLPRAPDAAINVNVGVALALKWDDGENA